MLLNLFFQNVKYTHVFSIFPKPSGKILKNINYVERGHMKGIVNYYSIYNCYAS